jgi:hypothetical protein
MPGPGFRWRWVVLLGIGWAGVASAADLAIRPELSDWRETSTSAEVVAHLEQAAALHPRLHYTTFGTSREGRPLPLLVVGPESVAAATPAAARAAGTLRVYVKGNIHAGEVAGKEALLRLVRELARGERAAWTRDWVLLIGPNYNPDGNDALDVRNRLWQHGPVAGMGTRENAQGLDLNRDAMKLAAPESRAFVSLLNTWDPHVVVDLHTTNGTHHAYHLTYAPGLHPATPVALDRFLRDDLLPAVTAAVEARWGWFLWHYGNVMERHGLEGWWTFDARPRFVTNYTGVRGRLAILSEAYSYLTFEDRVLASERFVAAILDELAARRNEVRDLVEATPIFHPGEKLPLRGVLPRAPPLHPILLGEVSVEEHPLTGEALLRRAEVVRPTPLPTATGFEPAEIVTVPAAYLLAAEAAEAVAWLRAHGVETETLARDWMGPAQRFAVTARHTAARPFQGRHEQSVEGSWGPVRTVTVPAGTHRVDVRQPLGRLAVLLVEPRADDGLLNGGAFAPWLDTDRELPLWRLPE